MKRTTIYLSDRQHEQLRQEAFGARVSMAELIRSRLDSTPSERGRRRWRKVDPLLRVAGIISDGNLSQGIDEAVYG